VVDGWGEEAIEAVPAAIVRLDTRGTVLRSNRFLAEICGVTTDALRGVEWLALVEPAAHAAARALWQSLIELGETPPTRLPLPSAKGAREIEWRHRMVEHPETGAPCVLAIGVDRTDEVASQRVLAARERQLAAAAVRLEEAQHVARVGSWELDLVGGRTTWSDETYRIMEVDPSTKDGLFEAFLARLHPEDRAEGLARFERAVARGEPLDDQARLVFPDGRIKYVRQRAVLMAVETDGDGRARRMVGTIEDVTAEEESARRLHTALAQWEALVAATPVAVVRLDRLGNVVFANGQWSELTGLAAAELAGDGWQRVVHPEDRERVRAVVARAVASLEPIRVEHRILRPDGEVRWVLGQSVAICDRDGELTGFVATVTDLTEHRASEEAVRAERALLRAMVESFPGIVGLYDAGGRRIMLSRRTLEIVGATAAPPGIVPTESTHITAQPELTGTIGDAIRAAQDGRPSRFDVMFGTAELQADIVPIRGASGEVTHIAAFGTEVTERNLARRRLAASEARLDEAQRLAGIGSWELDLATGALVCSAELLRMFGVGSDAPSEVRDRLLEAVHPDDIAALRTLHRRAVAEGTPLDLVRCMRLNDGSTKWLHLRCRIERDASGRPARSIGTVQDVSARQRVDESLRLHRSRLAQAMERAHLGAWERDLATGEEWWSAEARRMFAIDDDDPRPFDRFVAGVHADDRAAVVRAFAEAAAGRRWEGRYRVVSADGSTHQHHAVIDAVGGADASLLVRGFTQDVTEQVRGEQEIARVRDQLREVIDASPDLILVTTLEGDVELANRAFLAAVGLEPSPRETAAPGGDDLRAHAEPLVRALEVAVAGPAHERRRDPALVVSLRGAARTFDVVRVPLFDAEGCVYAQLNYARDVTDEHAAALSQRRSLVEKETLLREIHHRVKNNLALVSSLLHFQACKIEDAQLRRAFHEVQVRLLSMLLVHEQLYQSRDLSRVALGHYVRTLVDSLRVSLAEVSGVEIAVEVEDVQVPVELALPLGMIVSELVTNALKYAFVGRSGGHVRVTLCASAGATTLTVADDGVGLRGVRLGTVSSFGLRLVRLLAQQLGATVDADGDVPGTAITVRVPAAVAATELHA
jgi:PAS domain S-box-containing protein